MTILKLRFMIWLAKNVNYIVGQVMRISDRWQYDHHIEERNQEFIHELEEALKKETDSRG